MACGVCFVVYGDKAERELTGALGAIRKRYPSLPTHVMRERVQAPELNDAQQSRYAKVTLLDWTPYTNTLYMDADTRVVSCIDAGFDALKNGWDVAISPSANQGHDWLWHVGEKDRLETLRSVGFRALQLQAGVFFVKRNATTKKLFKVWRDEWLKHQNQDQAALLRALYAVPVKVFMLSPDWHGGAVVMHRWGSIRSKG